MEVRRFALGIVTGESLEAKLRAPRSPTDNEPGPRLRLAGPGRPERLVIAPSWRAKVPPREGMADDRQRGRILHGLANHELQAVELFAWGLLAFPEAPAAFRSGLLWLIAEEQRHCRMYMARMRELGLALGDHSVSGYFWSKARHFTTPLRLVCAMNLTFENANLDHTAEYAAAARTVGDTKTAALLEKVGADEIEHVRFGLKWLGEWRQEGQGLWDAYCANVTWPLRAALARGETFHPEPRRAAGMEPELLRLLAAARRDTRPVRKEPS